MSNEWSKCKGWGPCIHFHQFKVIKASSLPKCSQTRRQEGCKSSRWCGAAIHLAFRPAMPQCAKRMDHQNTLLAQNELTEAVGISLDLFCIHAKVLANKKEVCHSSCWCGTAIHLAFHPAMPQCAKQMDQNTLLTPNERTKEAVGTNQYVFCLHGEVPTNKKEVRDPCRSWGIAIHLAVSSSHAQNGPKAHE